MRRAFGFLFVFLLVLAGAASNAQAHSLGASFEKEVNGLLADVGYDPVEIRAGEYERFDFELWRSSEDRSPADYAYAWVRVLREKRTLLATGIHRQDIGPTTLLYTFAEPGAYVLSVSYRDADGNDIASVAFPVTVSSTRGSAGSPSVSIGAFLAGLLIGALACMWLGSVRKTV